jgi:hypothetical protein
LDTFLVDHKFVSLRAFLIASTQTLALNTVVQGQGRQKNNYKNKNRNFEEIIVSKKSFFAW